MEHKRIYKKPGILESLWLRFEGWINIFTTPECNPLYYLGAVGIFFLWVILVTGVYLFIFYSITADGAYESVRYLSEEQWYLGGIMRSLHRYASDGLVVVMILHALRTFVLDRYKHWRKVAWVTGVVIVWIVWIGGIFGYWMVWDERAQLVAILSADMIEKVPIFGLPLSLNFARVENLTDQLFYIVLFIHFSSLFFLFILLLIHLNRITKAVINPPRAMIYGLFLVLCVLSLLKPAMSTGPADLKRLPQEIPFDWFFMFIFPFLRHTSPSSLWLFIVVVTVMVGMIPWLTRERRNPAVEVTSENCTGCELCMEDCPYVAIQMNPRTDGLSYPFEAVVSPVRCASCGICMGACDYSAINLPDLTEDYLKETVRGLSRTLRATSQQATVFVFLCGKGPWVDEDVDSTNTIKGMEWLRVIRVPCVGMIHPSMLSIPLEEGVDGVFVAGCAPKDCHYRRGNEWFMRRLEGMRPPIIKKTVDRTRIGTVWLSKVQTQGFLTELMEFKKGLDKERKSVCFGPSLK